MMLPLKLFRTNLKSLKRFLWTVETRGDDLVLKEDKKEELRFPHIWLRDNCQCSSCFHKNSNSRIINIEHFDFSSRPLTANVKDLCLNVDWSDNHQSRYHLSWLIERQFSPDTRTEWELKTYRPQPQPWTATQFLDIVQRFNYKDILRSEKVLLKWLESLAIDGVAILEGAGTQLGQLQPIAERAAFLKQTYYGQTFSVRVKPGTSNVAYLSGPLQLHTDLPYYQYKPGVLMLHCLSQGDGAGGESQLVDGLSVCNWLREHHPHHYWILSTVPVEWEDVVHEGGKQFHTIYRAPVICEDFGGEVQRINFSQAQRGSHFNVPLDHVTPWYRALEVFSKQAHSSQSKVCYKMSQGEILTLNNLRMLHGRTDYEGDRHLEGAYLDWDYIYSKIRVIRKQLELS